jgi:hypothetical protein
MDQTEVSNFDYLEYLFWLGRVYGSIDPNNPIGNYQSDDLGLTLDEIEDIKTIRKDEYDSIKEAQETPPTDVRLDKNILAFDKYQKNYSESFTASYQEVFRKALPDTLFRQTNIANGEQIV